MLYRSLPVLAAIAFAACAPAARACDTWVALRNATADGSVILTKNSDRPPMEAQPLVQVPHAKHQPGEMVKCTYISVPQVAETYEHIGSKIWWAFGYEHGMNEYGVAIGNEAVFSKEPYQWGDGLLGMDMLRLGLERGKTAYEAMHVIIALLEKYGQSGDCEREGEWGHANYHNSFLIADHNEAWVLETAGRYWVAKRITNGVYSISNIYTIETDWDEAHPRLVEHAIEKGWTKSAADFNFARDYGDLSRNPGSAQLRRNATLGCLREAFANKVTPSTMMRISRTHLEGTVADPRWSAAEPFWATPCMHDTASGKYHTAATMIAHLRPSGPPMLRQAYWASFSNPCINVFQPFYLHGPKIPATYGTGTSKYSDDSPWWLANRVKMLCTLNQNALAPTARGMFDPTEKAEISEQPRVEAEAARLIEAGKDSEAAAVLQAFVDRNARRIGEEYRSLNETLPALLKTAGVKYLHTAFLKEWSSKTGTPLPLE